MPNVNVDDFRRIAKRKLPRAVFDHVDSGAGDETTVAANEAAFRAVKFNPRQLVDVSQRSQRTTVLGRQVETPVFFAPSGSQRLLHRDGELAGARAAQKTGSIYALSTASSCTIEEVREAAPDATLWFQVYMWRGRELVRSMVERAASAGYHAIVFTMDTPAPGLRDRDLKNGLSQHLRESKGKQDGSQPAKLSAFPELTLGHVVNALQHPEWLLRHYLFAPPITFKNVTADDLRAANSSWSGPGEVQKRMNPTATWEEVSWFREIWKGPLVVKGILTAESATLAFDHGADAVIVSNHGGRFLDTMPATFDVLPRVVQAAAGRGKEVLLDGGIRRGTDVVKALALGAKGCFIGRPHCYALAAAGEAGILELMQNFRNEIDSCLGHIGRPTIADLDPTALDFTAAPWHQAFARAAGDPGALPLA